MTKGRFRISLAMLLAAVCLGGIALFSAFSGRAHLFTASARTNEIVEDLIGILGSGLALGAVVVADKSGDNIGVRLYAVFAALVSLSLAFEFLLGFIWFAWDKFVPFWTTSVAVAVGIRLFYGCVLSRGPTRLLSHGLRASAR
jgi:hypothetical protein